MNTEGTLNEGPGRFRALVEAAADAVVCLDAPGKISFWNQKAGELFGYSAN